MITDICMNMGWRDCIELEIDEDIVFKASISNDSFTEALDNIAEDISEWITGKVLAWVDSYFDDHEEMTQEQLDLIKRVIEEARP